MSDDSRSQAHWSQVILDRVTKAGFAVPADRIRELWYNPLNPQSLRLTKFGLQIATVRADMITYLVDLDVKILPKHFLLLERACASPYYVKKLDELIVFDQQTAVMIQLHAGDFDAYFSNTLKYR
jgi:hypothetical protein